MKIDISVTRVPFSAMLVLEATVKGERFRIRYLGYPVVVAKALFRQHIKEALKSPLSSNLPKEFATHE